jgi:hypothetical protein
MAVPFQQLRIGCTDWQFLFNKRMETKTKIITQEKQQQAKRKKPTTITTTNQN